MPAPLNPDAGPQPPAPVKIHSAYRDRKLFVWGEAASQQGTAAQSLPFGAPPARVRHAISEIVPEKVRANYRDATIWVPTRDGKAIDRDGCPQQNEAIRPWTVPVAALSGDSALGFLDACNRNPCAESFDIKIAPTTRFWGAALRFVAALASRERFLPSLVDQRAAFTANGSPSSPRPIARRCTIWPR